jgi:glyoxylase-like metal-dependent hydrolase (beta-lactamase superfamily II)
MSFQILCLPLGMLQTNCYLIADETAKTCVVIDPGWDAKYVLDIIAENEWQLHAVWLTHAHFDHIGAVPDLIKARPVPLAIHPLDIPLLKIKGGAEMFGFHIPPLPEPTVLLKDGDTVECGTLKFQVCFVPGHTPGHVAFYAPQLKAVFSGDVLFKEGIGRTDLPGGDYRALMHSIKQVLFTLPDDTVVYSGHGPETTIGAEKVGNPF